MSARSGFRGQLSADERALLERLAVELGPRLLAYVRRICGPGHAAEDILAEAFCRAASNISGLRSSGRQDLYLLTIVRNLCRDRFRRLHPASPPDERIRRGSDVATDPHETVTEDERVQALREAVALLPDAVREVVVLRLSTDLKFEQSAEFLHIPLGTALSRMHAALMQLRKTLSCPDEC